MRSHFAQAVPNCYIPYLCLQNRWDLNIIFITFEKDIVMKISHGLMPNKSEDFSFPKLQVIDSNCIKNFFTSVKNTISGPETQKDTL
jgi:hypothetical protein